MFFQKFDVFSFTYTNNTNNTKKEKMAETNDKVVHDVFQRLVSLKLGFSHPHSKDAEQVYRRLSRNPRVPLSLIDAYKNYPGMDFMAISKNVNLDLSFVLNNLEKDWDIEKLTYHLNMPLETILRSDMEWDLTEGIFRRTDIAIEQLIAFTQSGIIDSPVNWYILSERDDFPVYAMRNWTTYENISRIPIWMDLNWVAMTINMPFCFIIEHACWPWIWPLLYLNRTIKDVDNVTIKDYFADKPVMREYILGKHDMLNTRFNHFTKRLFRNYAEKGYLEHLAHSSWTEKRYLQNVFNTVPHHEISWETIFTHPTKDWNLPLLLRMSEWEVDPMNMYIYLKGYPHLTVHSFLSTFGERLAKIWRIYPTNRLDLMILQRLHVKDTTTTTTNSVAVQEISNAMQSFTL